MTDPKNKADELIGKAKEAAGNAIDNDQMAAEGKGEQVKAKVQDAVDDAKSKVKEIFGK